MLEFSKEKVAGCITISKTISEEDIENIIVTALEGGCDYFLGIDNTTEDFKSKPEDEPISTWTTKLLLENKTVMFFDIETEELTFQLTLVSLLKGIKQNIIERSFDCDLDDMDATTADCIIQYALFEEIIFG